MTRPAFLPMTLPSRTLYDLPAAITGINAATAELRRTAFWRPAVVGAIGGREWKLTESAKRWNVHLHVCADFGSLSANEVRDWVTIAGQIWRDLTTGRGTLLLHPTRPFISSRTSRLRTAAYVSKARDWCPPPGALPIPAIVELALGGRGRQLPIAWGTCSNRRRRPDHAGIPRDRATTWSHPSSASAPETSTGAP